MFYPQVLDTNVIGSIDETAVAGGWQRYTFAFPNAYADTTHMLGFRIDPFTNIQSSVLVTNVFLGVSGPRQSFSLNATTAFTNSLRILQLQGESGFTYTVEASTNLTDWEISSFLLNTNGIVNFVDPESTNSPMRFYRASAQ